MPDPFSNDEGLTTRVTFRIQPSEYARVCEAAALFGMEPTRFVRRALLKAMKDLAPEIEKRRGTQSELPL